MTELTEWVNNASESNSTEKIFRHVVHIILDAISNSHDLQANMVMKGGILLAIRYKTGRHTSDIDFSTSLHYKQFQKNEQAFIEDLNNEIKKSAETMPYNIACEVQTFKIEPKADGNFQTLRLSIGYAQKDNKTQMKRLQQRSASSTVKIDYSFNEILGEIDVLDGEGTGIQVYSLTTLIAEKLRAILQQESRGRNRRQDIYDVYFLLSQSGFDREDEDMKEMIHSLLIAKAASRDLQIHKNSMSTREIFNISKKGYSNLQDTIESDLPDFETAFEAIQKYYESMPWAE